MTLPQHTISSITTVQLGYEYLRTIGRNSFLGSHGSGGSMTAYVVETDRGATGWGLPLSDGDPGPLIGRPLADLIDPERGVVDPAAEFLDYPLHDLAARILDVPVYAMLGGAGSPRVRCYSGGIYFDDLEGGLDAIRANLAQDHAFGFRDFKLKIGRGHRWMEPRAGLQRDIEVTRLTRELYPDAAILVDGNDGFTLNGLLEYLDAVADCDLYWIEEPFPERRPDLQALHERVPALPRIADGEYDPNVQHVLSLAADGLIDVALMDVIGHGLTAWRHTMPLLKAEASPHAWGLPLKTLYAAHLSAGLGNTPIIEGVPGPNAYTLEDGHVLLTEEPGFGLTLDRALAGA
ncbi:enolase C-terminal domain-like protein [Kribbella sp.]|uniref:enolase C-terminal domain-like protein n=1 Tax=Kribbella sp. TaxID=1871183 RepID=UPI002D50E8A0|nr:enolase C-terminal domain-like protein [Kribbella sp.]HZX04505.1 enolase C-terminal domain-like protein [Kribbella sp.]